MGKNTKPKDKFFNYNSMNTRLLTIVMLTLMLGISACVDVEITTPHGPQGPKGPDGASDYDLWKQEVEAGRIEWDKEKLALTDFFKFLKGNDGQDGTNGTDGKNGKSAYELWKEKVLSEEGVENPHNKGNKWSKDETSVPDFWRYLTGGTGEVGQVPQIKEDENGVPYWYVGDDKIRKATGEDGDPGDNAVPPTVEIEDGFWKVNGVKTDKTATPTDGTNGKPGKTPTVDINPTTGNWILNGEETNTPAKGQDGHTPVVTIDPKTGEWKIDGNPTGKTAFGQKGLNGDNGQDGKSAYELWKEEVEKGTLKDPHNEGSTWPPELNKPTDFWDYLLGGDEYKVVLIHALRRYPTEMVNPYDGSVAFQILDAKGNLEGGTVTGISPVDLQKSFTASFRSSPYEIGHRKTHFVLKRNDLPDKKSVEERTVYPKIKVRGKAKTYVSSEPVVVPNQVHIRAVMVEEIPSSSPRYLPSFLIHRSQKRASLRAGSIRTAVRVERQVDGGEWEPLGKYNMNIAHDLYLLDVKQKPTAELLSSEHARKIPYGGYTSDRPNHVENVTSYRTIRLTSEMVDAYTNGTEEQKKILNDYSLWGYRGDDTWTYAAIGVGDNDGEKENEERGGKDYGEFVVIPELIYYPPEDLSDAFNHSKIYVDKTTDPSNPIIWGEVDYASRNGEYYDSGSRFIKEEDNGFTLWKPDPKSKKQKKDNSSAMIVSLIDPAKPYADVESIVTSFRLYETQFPQSGRNFYLKKAKDGYYIATNFMYITGTSQLSGDYYGTVRYKVKHDTNTDKWYLVNIWKPSEEYELQEKVWPGEQYYNGMVDEEGNKYPYITI